MGIFLDILLKPPQPLMGLFLVTEVVFQVVVLEEEVVLHHTSLVTEVVLDVVELHHASSG